MYQEWSQPQEDLYSNRLGAKVSRIALSINTAHTYGAIINTFLDPEIAHLDMTASSRRTGALQRKPGCIAVDVNFKWQSLKESSEVLNNPCGVYKGFDSLAQSN